MDKETILVKDDIERAIALVRERRPECDQPLTEMIFDQIHKLREGGYDITYLGSVLTNHPYYVHTGPGEDADVRVFFHLIKVNQAGEGVDVASFIVINLTNGTVTDCSANIVTTH
ncbi:hypothetical protein D3C76_25280 [compost metagenome]